MIKDWTAYGMELRKGVAALGKGQPKLLPGYKALNDAAHATTHLDAKTRELIGLAVAVTTRCDGCINAHAAAAVKAGASDEEIAEALGVAIALNTGAALTYAGHVMDAVAAKRAG